MGHKKVKIRHILILCSAAAMPQLAMADLSVTNPAGLGQMHALLDFCSQANPQNSASFQAEWKSIVGDQASLLAQLEQNSAYKQQYAAFTSELLKMPKGQTTAICAVSAAAWNGSAVRPDGYHGKDDRDSTPSKPSKPDKGSDPDHKPGHPDR
jgi:hypothetical protein